MAASFFNEKGEYGLCHLEDDDIEEEEEEEEDEVGIEDVL